MQPLDRSAASSLRRRTSCIYCGRRISGKLELGILTAPLPSDESLARVTRLRRSAHIACRCHLDLPALDPDYRERL